MTARKRHFVRDAADIIANTDGAATDVICGQQPRREGDTLWATADRNEVTCGHCLRVMADVMAHVEAAESAVLVAETETYLATVSTYTAPVEVIDIDLSDKAIAVRHGLQRYEVENAINDGWLKR